MVEYEFNQAVCDKSPYLIYQSLRGEPSYILKPDSSNLNNKFSFFEWFLSRNKEKSPYQKSSKSKTTN